MNHLFGDRVLNGQFLQLMSIVLPVLRRIGQRSGEPLGDLRFQPSDGLFVSLGGRELRSGCWLINPGSMPDKTINKKEKRDQQNHVPTTPQWEQNLVRK